MTEQLPAPLVPTDVDLRDFGFMPVEINRLRKSKAWLWAKREPELGFYMFNLWSVSWHETPAASLEDDDDVLADAAMCDPKRWPKVKAKVMHGWVLCSDGRWYHPVVAEKALEAWKAKTKQRQRTAAATKARQSTPTFHNLNREHRNDQRDENRDDDRHEERNVVESVERDVDVTSTKGQGREGIGKGIEQEVVDARPLLARICEIFRIRLEADPERFTWQRQVEEMLRDGIPEADIIAGAEVARTNAVLKLTYVRAAALKIGTRKEINANGRPKRESVQDAWIRTGAELAAEFAAGDDPRDSHPPNGSGPKLLEAGHGRGRSEEAVEGHLRRSGGKV